MGERVAFLLSGGSAIEWLRIQRNSMAAMQRYVIPYNSLEGSLRRLKRHQSAIESLSRPIQLITWNREDRRRTKQTICRAMSLPGGLYPCFRIEPGLFCSAPELVFLQMARLFDEERLLFLGFELCGRYGIANGKSFMRPCVCPPASVEAFLATCSGVHGRKRAVHVLSHVLCGAASPMESALAICLTIPRDAGGFGLPAPELNRSLPVEGEARRLWDTDSITPDLLWEEAKLAIEYDSDDEHTAAERITVDSMRRNVLEEMGYRVISVTNGIFSDPVQLERVASVVAKALGCDSVEAVDEEWMLRAAFVRRIRQMAMHPEVLCN